MKLRYNIHAFWHAISHVTHIPVAYRTTNVGDDIQSYAAADLFHCNNFVDRDCMADWPSDAIVPLIGWFGYGVPSTAANCLIVGTHIQVASRKHYAESRSVDWLKSAVRAQGFPAMARDISTRDFLRELGVESEFGGCVTQTLERYEGKRSGTLIIDVQDKSIKGFRDTHERPHLPMLSPEERVMEARVQVARLARFETVHTTRLHAALPCIALGTNVEFHREQARFQPERLSGYEGVL